MVLLRAKKMGLLFMDHPVYYGTDHKLWY